MFDNIGCKIKTLAKVVCWLGIITSVVAGIAMVVIDEEFLVIGFSLLFLGPILSWISSFMAYGFGQLIENTDRLVEKNTETMTTLPTINPVQERVQALYNWKQQGLITEEEYKQQIEMLSKK